MKDMMNAILSAQATQAEAMIQKHKVNIEVLTKNAAGVAEHPDIMDTVEKELTQLAHWQDIKSAISIFDFNNKRPL